MKPITIKGRQYFSLNEIAAAIMSGKIRLSDIPTSAPAPAHKTILAPVPEIKPSPPQPLTTADVKGRTLRATLIHHGDEVDYRFTPKWPYVIVPVEILDLPLGQQRNIVRKAIDKIKPLWEEEKKQREAAFMANREEGQRHILYRNIEAVNSSNGIQLPSAFKEKEKANDTSNNRLTAMGSNLRPATA